MKNGTSIVMLSIATIAASLALAACGKSSGGVTGDPAAPGSGPTGSGVSINQCQVGQVYNSSYGCLNHLGCQQPGYGMASNYTCVSGKVVSATDVFGTASYAMSYVGSMTVTNPAQYSFLLRYSGQCDPSSIGGTSTYSCDTYTSRGGAAQLQVFNSSNTNGNNMNLVLTAGSSSIYGVSQFFNYANMGASNVNLSNPMYPNTYQNGYQNNGFNTLNTGTNNYNAYSSFGGYGYNASQIVGLSQQARGYNLSTSAGFEVDGIDFNQQDNGLHLIIDQGHIGDWQPLRGRLVFKGVDFATVTLNRNSN